MMEFGGVGFAQAERDWNAVASLERLWYRHIQESKRINGRKVPSRTSKPLRLDEIDASEFVPG